MEDATEIAVSHVGICVADLDRARRFYVEALGGEATEAFEVDETFAGLVELPDVRMRIAYVSLGGFRLELICYARPEAIGPAERRPMNQLGFTHLNLMVGDLAAVAERVRACGGAVIEGTRTATARGTMIFCTDPDGTRIELWQQ